MLVLATAAMVDRVWVVVVELVEERVAGGEEAVTGRLAGSSSIAVS